jgi:hypothetical protein
MDLYIYALKDLQKLCTQVKTKLFTILLQNANKQIDEHLLRSKFAVKQILNAV